MKPHRAMLSIGSNLGDKAANCENGLAALEGEGGTVILKRSSFYRTAPVDYLDQDWFVNQAAEICTALSPLDLLKALKGIEAKMGRKAGGVRFGPRMLDMDIIFFDDAVIDTPDLVIPHPRMHKRRFVLQPLCDIDPTRVHPILKRDVRFLLAALDDNRQEVVPFS